ncbi:MAG: hypothetical protein JRN65_04640, partial [Nitrososphaerota archaeon]|nr:hypothetical protein [Nitrososphaerota archaeon]
MIKACWPRALRRTEEVAGGPLVSVEGKIAGEGAVSLEVSFARDYWETLETFLRQKIGYLTEREKADAMSPLLDYGAHEESTARELTMTEKFAVGAKHSSLKFRMFKCFQANKAIAVGLTVHLTHNKSLERKVAELRG